MLKTIVLIGMMGSGKTSVGKELAKNLNLNFIDSDQEIEKKCKISIPFNI
jgi:shikimate kinase